MKTKSETLILDLLEATRQNLNFVELLKQKNFTPMAADEQFVILFAGLNGLLDDVEVSDISNLEEFILSKFRNFEFYDEEAEISVIQIQLTESLIDIINE